MSLLEELREKVISIAGSIWVIEKKDVGAVMEVLGCSRIEDELLVKMVELVESSARPPISNFNVGIAGLTVSGNIYCGVNLEFRGLPLNNSVHGEQFMVSNMLLHEEDTLVAMAGAWPPCGHCRQYLMELGCADSMKLCIARRNETPQLFDFVELLPAAFSPRDLQVTERVSYRAADTKQRLRWSHTDLIALAASSSSSSQSSSSSSEFKLQGESAPSLGFNVKSFRDVARAASVSQKVRERALAAANLSYAPYSKSPCGVAIELDDGSVHSGFYIENAAFNPSMSAVQSALVGLVINDVDYARIAAVVLVEKEVAEISHQHTSQLLVRAIAPKAKFIALPVIDQAAATTTTSEN
jgi:cytidine deaminase